jgi:hypothetical protein
MIILILQIIIISFFILDIVHVPCVTDTVTDTDTEPNSLRLCDFAFKYYKIFKRKDAKTQRIRVGNGIGNARKMYKVEFIIYLLIIFFLSHLAISNP